MIHEPIHGPSAATYGELRYSCSKEFHIIIILFHILREMLLHTLLYDHTYIISWDTHTHKQTIGLLSRSSYTAK